MQNITKYSPKDWLFHINYHSLRAGNSGGRELCHRTHKDLYGQPYQSNDFPRHASVHTAQGTESQIKSQKNVTRLQLFVAKEAHTLVCIDILGEFIEKPRRNEYLLLITDRFSKMTKTVPMKRISAAEVSRNFLNCWVSKYGPPAELIADNGGWFTAKLFIDVCELL